MKQNSYRQLIPYLKPQSHTIILALVCTGIFTVFWPILASLAGFMAEYIGQGNVRAIADLATFAAFIFLLRGAAQYLQDALMAEAALAIAFDLRCRVYSHLQTLDLKYFETAKTGDLSYRLTEDVDRIGEVINKLFHQFIPCVLQFIVVIGYMIYLNWELTFATIIIAPLFALLIGWFGERLHGLSRASQSQISALSALLTEVFAGIRLIQALSANDYEIKRFTESAIQNRRIKYNTERAKALQFVIVGFLEAIAVMILFFLGGWQISRNNLTGTEFISYIAAVALLIDPISLITSNYSEFKQGQASVDRIFELMKIEPEIKEIPNAMVLSDISGQVSYEQVSFAYDPEQSVLKNIDLIVSPGEVIALVGKSGAGKSTLINLLFRFYDPQVGLIKIDGIDIKTVTLSSLRSFMAIVPQETILFSGTVADNIAFGKIHLDLEEIKTAAKIANAHDFIMELPNQYQTKVGERGVNLSGGQRQRIAIARAILTNPKILILDEATSALDSESEQLVKDALEKVMRSRTVFIIAHRLATIRQANRILVMEQGEIIESGTHEELLAQNTRYAQFYAMQFE